MLLVKVKFLWSSSSTHPSSEFSASFHAHIARILTGSSTLYSVAIILTCLFSCALCLDYIIYGRDSIAWTLSPFSSRTCLHFPPYFMGFSEIHDKDSFFHTITLLFECGVNALCGGRCFFFHTHKQEAWVWLSIQVQWTASFPFSFNFWERAVVHWNWDPVTISSDLYRSSDQGICHKALSGRCANAQGKLYTKISLKNSGTCITRSYLDPWKCPR